AQIGNTGQQIVATADEVNGIQPDDPLFSVTAGLEAQYRDIGRLNFTFAPPAPPPPLPQINIKLFTLDPNNNNLRVPAEGILQSGQQVVIAFKSNLTIVGASISGTQVQVVTPDYSDATNGATELNLLTARVKGLYPLDAAGTYIITVTAENPLSLNQVSSSIGILVVGVGGSNNTP